MNTAEPVSGVIETPVLLIIFNRPDLTRKVLRAIAAVRPKIFLVAADGPRTEDEKVLCDAAREVMREVDWHCEVRTNYAEQNLGCGVRVYTAIDWALNQFEEVIILEDDCVPDPSFFSFCHRLLAHYRDDQRVMHIGGFNFQPKEFSNIYSYFFSKYTIASGGFATWRRAWKHYNWKLSIWQEVRDSGFIESFCGDPYEQRYWREIGDTMSLGAKDVWDYQWNLSCWTQNGLAILPSVHLLSNVGFGDDATHTKQAIPCLSVPMGKINKIIHPPMVFQNFQADAYIFGKNFGGENMKRADSAEVRIRRWLRPLLSPLRWVRKLCGLGRSRQRSSGDF